MVHWPSGADEHQAHDPWFVPVCAGDGLVVVRTGLGDGGTGLADEDRLGSGLGDDAGRDRTAQRRVAELAGHFRAATDTRLSFPDARQAVTVTCWPDAPAGPDSAAQRSVAELAGHFRAATDTALSFPEARQAVTVTPWPDALHGLASFTVCGTVCGRGYLPAP